MVRPSSPTKTLITPALFSRPLPSPHTGRRGRKAKTVRPGPPLPVWGVGRGRERGQGVRVRPEGARETGTEYNTGHERSPAHHLRQDPLWGHPLLEGVRGRARLRVLGHRPAVGRPYAGHSQRAQGAAPPAFGRLGRRGGGGGG